MAVGKEQTLKKVRFLFYFLEFQLANWSSKIRSPRASVNVYSTTFNNSLLAQTQFVGLNK